MATAKQNDALVHHTSMAMDLRTYGPQVAAKTMVCDQDHLQHRQSDRSATQTNVVREVQVQLSHQGLTENNDITIPG